MSEVAYRGSKRRIIWASDASGRSHGKEYFVGLSTTDQAKLWALIERMGDIGEIKNVQKFRHEEDGLYCFKSFKRRLMCFMDRRDVVITHGFDKKRDRLDRRQLERGARLRIEYQAPRR